MIRIALAQTNPLIGDVAGNLARVRELAGRAAARGADLVAFPELTLIGYPPKDLLFDSRLLAVQDEALRALLGFSHEWPTTLVVGIALPNHAPGKPRFNLKTAVSRCLPHDLGEIGGFVAAQTWRWSV